jgi:hypothetical protein
MEPSLQPIVKQRIRFKTQIDWVNYTSAPRQLNELHQLRLDVYEEIQQLRKRPILVYASNFTSNLGPNAINISGIRHDDVYGFTDLLSNVPTSVKEVDIIIHSPGGQADTTERIVSILRNRFEKIHFLVPHSAYSAATMLALSGNSITLHPSATLGPIDPQLNGIPARSIIRGFENVKEAIKREGPEALPAYIPLIEKYTLDQLEQCNDAANLSKELVKSWLTEYMFEGNVDSDQIDVIVNYFSSYDDHKTHSRPLIYDKLKNFGLIIEQSDESLTTLLWEIFIMLSGFFDALPFAKLYENSFGLSFGRSFNLPTPAANQINPSQTPGNSIIN